MNKWYRILIIFFVVIFSFIAIMEYSSTITDLYGRLTNTFRHFSTGKILVVGRAGDAISLDPADTTEMDSIKVSANIFETLVKYEKEGNQILPCLAESWKSSEDGLTWTFRLRQDVKFHDGTVFDAHAVEFNFKRWMYTDNAYHIGQFSYWNYIFGGFPGFVSNVSALSDYTVEIKLTRPYAPFLSTLAMPIFGISSPESIKKYGEEVYRHPVGTGPFCFKSWEPGKSIILTRNEKYWGDLAKVDELEFKVIPSSAERLKELKEGTLQIADNLGPDDVSAIERDSNLKLYLRPCFNVGYIAMNNEKPPFDKREVRVAVSHAINKEGLIKDVFANLAKPAKTLIPPILWGYNENIVPYDYDPQKSIELLKKAGFPNGFDSTLWVMNCSRDYFPKPLEVAEYIKENLKQVNINVTIKTCDWDEYLDRIDRGEHELALIGWTGDSVDPDNFLNTLLSSSSAKPGLAGNYSFYRNKEVDSLLAQARQTSNMIFRRNLYRSLQEIVNYDAPSVPLVHTMPVVAARTSVVGYTPGITGVESFENVDIKKE